MDRIHIRAADTRVPKVTEGVLIQTRRTTMRVAPMRMLRVAIVLLVIAAMQDTGPRLLAQARDDGPRFEVVSIRPHPPSEPGRPPAGSSVNQRPDGGLNMVNVPISALL